LSDRRGSRATETGVWKHSRGDRNVPRLSHRQANARAGPRQFWSLNTPRVRAIRNRLDARRGAALRPFRQHHPLV
jgi:hypothetical protein